MGRYCESRIPVSQCPFPNLQFCAYQKKDRLAVLDDIIKGYSKTAVQGNAETAGQAVQDEAQQAQAVPQRAIERIPQKGVTKDEDGNEMPAYDWEKAKPEDTYDALKDEIFGGDEKQTADPINATIREIESEGKKKQEQLDKISGGDVASAVRNAAKRKALKAELDELRKRVDYWRSVLAVPAQRAKAEQEKVAGSEIQPVGEEGSANGGRTEGNTGTSDNGGAAESDGGSETDEVDKQEGEKEEKKTEEAKAGETKAEKTKNEGQFGLVSDERMAELKRRLHEKLNNMNSGIDPEMLAVGLEMTAGYIDRGIKTFTSYAKAMITEFGEAVRPYLKAFYNGVRDMPEVVENGLDKEMDDYDTVKKTNVTAIRIDGEERHPDIVEEAEQRSTEAKVEREAKKIQKQEESAANTFTIMPKDYITKRGNALQLKWVDKKKGLAYLSSASHYAQQERTTSLTNR